MNISKRFFPLLLIAVFVISLAGCQKSDYTDRSVSVPAEWPRYEVSGLSYRFEAGFTATDSSEFSDSLSYALGSIDNDLKVLGLFVSPLRDKGTVDLLEIGCYYMDYTVTPEDLLTLKDQIDNLDFTLTEGQFVAVVEQQTTLGVYNNVTALTYSLLLTHGEVSSSMQVGLFADDKTLYQVVYCDFTSASDNNYLERFLSSVKFK